MSRSPCRPGPRWLVRCRELRNLKPGTGRFLDMGGAVTFTGARITLGSIRGAGFRLRVGATAAALADLPPAARATDADGRVGLRFARPVHGRYVLIWFTRLPRDAAGTFQAGVYDVRLARPTDRAAFRRTPRSHPLRLARTEGLRSLDRRLRDLRPWSPEPGRASMAA